MCLKAVEINVKHQMLNSQWAPTSTKTSAPFSAAWPPAFFALRSSALTAATPALFSTFLSIPASAPPAFWTGTVAVSLPKGMDSSSALLPTITSKSERSKKVWAHFFLRSPSWQLALEVLLSPWKKSIKEYHEGGEVALKRKRGGGQSEHFHLIELRKEKYWLKFNIVELLILSAPLW